MKYKLNRVLRSDDYYLFSNVRCKVGISKFWDIDMGIRTFNIIGVVDI